MLMVCLNCLLVCSTVVEGSLVFNWFVCLDNCIISIIVHVLLDCMIFVAIMMIVVFGGCDYLLECHLMIV